jgi:hypothetical protein
MYRADKIAFAAATIIGLYMSDASAEPKTQTCPCETGSKCTVTCADGTILSQACKLDCGNACTAAPRPGSTGDLADVLLPSNDPQTRWSNAVGVDLTRSIILATQARVSPQAVLRQLGDVNWKLVLDGQELQPLDVEGQRVLFKVTLPNSELILAFSGLLPQTFRRLAALSPDRLQIFTRPPGR